MRWWRSEGERRWVDAYLGGGQRVQFHLLIVLLTVLLPARWFVGREKEDLVHVPVSEV
jgi:hypothetical protein